MVGNLMNKTALIYITLSLLLLSSNVCPAYAQDSYNIFMKNFQDNIQINIDGTADISTKFTIVNNGTSGIDSINIRLNTILASNITINSEKEISSFSKTISSLGTELKIMFNEPIAIGENIAIQINYISSDLTSLQNIDQEDNQQSYIFIYYMRPTYPILNYSLNVALPKAAYLNDNISQPIYPQPTNNYTDGLRINFRWERARVLPGQESLFVIFYQENEQFIIVSDNIIELIVFLIAGVLIGLLLSKIVPKIISRIRIKHKVTTRLTRDEKKIIKYLQKKGGIAPQKNIYIDLNMSQARISLILSDLEEKGHIRRDKRGRENIVRLAEYTD